MSEPQARLVLRKSDGTDVVFHLERPVMLVGRDADADIQVEEPLVSRNHARLERRGAAWFLLDLGSTNLTKVNGALIRERKLEDGDEIHFARARLTFLL